MMALAVVLQQGVDEVVVDVAIDAVDVVDVVLGKRNVGPAIRRGYAITIRISERMLP